MDEQITAKISAGEHREALKELAQAYSAQVGRFCAGVVGSLAEADELMQETFIEAWAAMPRFRAESSARAWLFGIARRICIRHLRKRDRRAGLTQRYGANGAGVARPNGNGPEDRAGQSEEKALLHRALGELKPDLRQAVLLRYQAGLEHAEIATALGIRPAAARKRVSLAIQALRAQLRPLLLAPPQDRDGAAPEENDHDPEEPVSETASIHLLRP